MKAADVAQKVQNISIAMVSPETMRAVNRRYRKKDKSTDVLSFDYKDGAGEVLINRKEDHFEFLLLHGILHILGYTHKQMEKNKNYVQLKKATGKF